MSLISILPLPSPCPDPLDKCMLVCIYKNMVLTHKQRLRIDIVFEKRTKLASDDAHYDLKIVEYSFSFCLFHTIYRSLFLGYIFTPISSL